MTWIEADEGLQAQATTKVTCCRAQQRSRSISALSAGCSTLRPRQYLVLYPSGYWAPIFVIGLDKRARTVRKPSNFPPSGQFSIIIEPGRVSRLGLRPHPRPEHGLDSTRVADLSGGMGRGVGHRLVMGSEPEQWRRRGGLVGLGRWRECLDHSDGSHGANDDHEHGDGPYSGQKRQPEQSCGGEHVVVLVVLARHARPEIPWVIGGAVGRTPPISRNERPPLSVQSFTQESNDVLPRLLAWQGNPPPSTFSSASSFSFLSGLGRSPHPSTSSVGFAPPDEICPLLTLTLDSLIRPQLNVFFERVYPMIPVFARDEVLLRLNSTGLRDRDFIAMILSMTALSLVHPLNASEELQRVTRARQATMLLDEACRLSARWDYGCAASTESVLTSYLMFGTLFELGHASGARMRLRESISMGEAMRLDDPEAYAGLDSNEARRRMRMYWILAVTER
jgi:hypothetical protein